MTTPCTGTHVAIRRVTKTENRYRLSEVRLYQTPNLLQELEGTVTLTAPEATSPEWAANNLITNMQNRSPGNDFNVIIDDGGVRGSYKSCYKTSRVQLEPHGDFAVMTFDLGESHFQHSILFVQDIFALLEEEQSNYVGNISVYIGDNPDWSQNPLCLGSPFLGKSDASSFSTVNFRDVYVDQQLWKYGFEAWCNMQGRYTHIVFPLSWPNPGSENNMSICSIGIFGTKYVRDSLIPGSVSVEIGKSTTFTVAPIRSHYTIGNSLDIHLRQKAGVTELPFVTLTQGNPARVLIDASSTPPGEYTLILESFDNNGSVKSALMTDTVRITVSAGCQIDPTIDATLLQALAAQPLRFSTKLAGQEGFDTVSYESQLALISNAIADPNAVQSCEGTASLQVTLVAADSLSLDLNKPSKLVQLISKKKQVTGTFASSYLLIALGSSGRVTWRVPIEVTYQECRVAKLSFQTRQMIMTYKVGSGEPLSETLPAVVQEPDCKLTFDKFELESIESRAGGLSEIQIKSAITFDGQAGTLLVQTGEESFIGEEVRAKITFKQDVVEKVDDLRVTIFFEAKASETESANRDQLTQNGPKDSEGAVDESARGARDQQENNAEINIEEQALPDKFDELAKLGIPDLEVPEMEEEQKELLETPVDAIPEKYAFVPIPLAGRLSKGVENVKEMALKQRKFLTQQAGKQKDRLPETRMKADNFRAFRISFTESVDFPSNVEDKMRQQIDSERRRLKQSGTSGRSPVQVFAFRGQELESDDEEAEPVMNDWDLVSVDSEGMLVKLQMPNPLSVSSGDNPDLLFVQLDLGEYQSASGVKMPDSVVKYISIPTQIASEEEAQNVDIASTATTGTASSAMGSNFILNVILAGNMEAIWSVFNGLQIVELFNLFHIKQPGNVSSFSQFFEVLTDVKIVDSSAILSEMFYLPELEPYTLSFQMAGYSTSLFLDNASNYLFNFTLHMSLVMILLFSITFSRVSARCHKLHGKLRNHMFWNGTIRMFMEAYLDFALFSLLNIQSMQWPEGLAVVAVSNYLSYALLGFCGAIPFILLVFAIRQKSKWQDENFKQQYGAFLEGTSRDSKGQSKAILLFAMVFFVRRIILCLTLVFWSEFFWGQISLQFLISTLLIIVIQWARPLDTIFATWMETFNECTNLILLYILMLFSDFVGDPETRSQIGIAYMVIIICFAAVHLFFLFADSAKSLAHKCKECSQKRKQKKLQEQKVKESKPEARQLSVISEEGESEGLESVESQPAQHNSRRRPKLRMTEFHPSESPRTSLNKSPEQRSSTTRMVQSLGLDQTFRISVLHHNEEEKVAIEPAQKVDQQIVLESHAFALDQMEKNRSTFRQAQILTSNQGAGRTALQEQASEDAGFINTQKKQAIDQLKQKLASIKI